MKDIFQTFRISKINVSQNSIVVYGRLLTK